MPYVAPKNVMTKSRYTDLVDENKPLDVYPRPLLARSAWINLNGHFRYAVTSADVKYPEKFDGDILVPFCIESPLSGVGKALAPDQKLWYERIFVAPALAEDERLILHFEAVDYIAEIFVNHKPMGRHVGGYLPFSFDISEAIADGMNELVVGVTDPSDAGSQERGKQVLDPKGIWYTATSGIWQTVWMEVVHNVRIVDLAIVPDFDGSKVKIVPTLSLDFDVTLILTIGALGNTVVKTQLIPDADNAISLPGFRSWSPEDPFLYDVIIEVREDGILRDIVKSYFGMRKIELGKDGKGIPRVLLNGKQYFQAGVLDQGYWPDGLLTQPTDAALVDDIATMKRLGFNMLRKHIKVESQRWYYHCDRLGMLVWQDMPSGGEGVLGKWLGGLRAYTFPHLPIDDHRYERFGRAKEDSRTEYLNVLAGMIDRLANHPSIVCWVPFNEAWGQFDANITAEYVKSLDPTRLVDHASGWFDQQGGDFHSIHRYFLDVRAPRPERRRPFVLTEFGGYSLVSEGHVWNPEGSFGYRMFGTKTELTKAYAELLAKQIVPLVKKGLCATVYTQLSDVEREVNGLVTYDRAEIKIDEQKIRELNRLLTM